MDGMLLVSVVLAAELFVLLTFFKIKEYLEEKGTKAYLSARWREKEAKDNYAKKKLGNLYRLFQEGVIAVDEPYFVINVAQSIGDGNIVTKCCRYAISAAGTQICDSADPSKTFTLQEILQNAVIPESATEILEELGFKVVTYEVCDTTPEAVYFVDSHGWESIDSTCRTHNVCVVAN